MNKIRKWFFKLLTGYDLAEYREVLVEWNRTLKHAEEVNALAKAVNKECREMLELSKEIFEKYEELSSVNNEVNANETLD